MPWLAVLSSLGVLQLKGEGLLARRGGNTLSNRVARTSNFYGIGRPPLPPVPVVISPPPLYTRAEPELLLPLLLFPRPFPQVGLVLFALSVRQVVSLGIVKSEA